MMEDYNDMVYNLTMNICKKCKDRIVKVKEKCVRCYYAEKRGFKSDFEKLKEQNYEKNGVFFLGSEFQVDKEDYLAFKNHFWSNNGAGYAKNYKLGYLHRNIAPKLSIVDHIDHDTFNNRRINLREGKYVNVLNTSKRKAPCPIYRTRQGKWYAQTCIDGKKFYIKANENRDVILSKLTAILTKANRINFYKLI